MNINRIVPIALLLSLLGCLNTARASDYPTRPIRLIVGYSPSGAGDGIARIGLHPVQ
jgi:tripartite-type tricarboxylate transporter receptor subunit TctC